VLHVGVRGWEERGGGEEEQGKAWWCCQPVQQQHAWQGYGGVSGGQALCVSSVLCSDSCV
jgi:hypothetical protein